LHVQLALAEQSVERYSVVADVELASLPRAFEQGASHMAQAELEARPELHDLEWYRTMRDGEPVWRDPRTSVWNVFRYQDAAAVLADCRTFSSDFSQVFPCQAELTEGNILATDPPYHHQLRGLVSQAFTPRAIAQLEPHIEDLTEELLDRTQGRNQIELVSDLAYPLPVIVIAELLGVPITDRSRFKTWADALLAQDTIDPHDTAAIEQAAAQLRRFHDYLREHVAQRRAQPRQDLLTDLVAAEVDGQRLSDQEIVGFATILLLSGHITTTILLGNTIRCLDEHPHAQDALRADPAAIPAAIEEVLRYRSPVALTARVTTTAAQIGQQEIAPREMVNLWLLSANHDERQFEHPDDFVVERQPNPHLGFGKGIHFCLGAPLARLESRIALGVLLRRFSHLRVDTEYPLESYADPGINGSRSLHLVVERA
jgi:cytochrome P450